MIEDQHHYHISCTGLLFTLLGWWLSGMFVLRTDTGPSDDKRSCPVLQCGEGNSRTPISSGPDAVDRIAYSRYNFIVTCHPVNTTGHFDTLTPSPVLDNESI